MESTNEQKKCRYNFNLILKCEQINFSHRTIPVFTSYRLLYNIYNIGMQSFKFSLQKFNLNMKDNNDRKTFDVLLSMSLK